VASSKKTILSAFRRTTNETHQLERNPSQPRSTADDEKLEELIATILQKGLIQPIAVRPTSESTYEIIAGHRRVAAFQRLYERTKGTDRQRRYEAIHAIVKEPLSMTSR
jgi:hypothetical protein